MPSDTRRRPARRQLPDDPASYDPALRPGDAEPTNPNMLLLGQPGTGKSTLVKCLLKRVLTSTDGRRRRVDVTAKALDLDDEEAAVIGHLSRGAALWKAGARSAVRQHTLGAGEWALCELGSRLAV
jgi:hypothetical protein